MKSSDHDIARRVLASVLDRLEGEKLNENALPAVEQPVSPSNVFIIMLGNNESGNTTGEQTSAQSGISYIQPALADSSNQKRLSEAHPGLQRFDLPLPDTCSTAPKMCFLEPDRVCVNSGACQTLGH
jgi:hypothetical protein